MAKNQTKSELLAENAELLEKLVQINEEITDLFAYYGSPKFREDYAFVSTDIMPRLRNLRNVAMIP